MPYDKLVCNRAKNIEILTVLIFLKVLIVITDANVDEDEGALAESAAQDLKDSGIIVQTVGISDELSLANLVALATSDDYVWPEVDDEMLANLRKLGKEPCRR